MGAIRRYIRRRRIRKLAEKLLTGRADIWYQDRQGEIVKDAIKIANKFYETWDREQ